MYKARLFYNSCFDTVNIPNGYDQNIFSRLQHRDVPTMDIVQASLLSEIRVKVNSEQDVIGADYLMLYVDSYNPDTYAFTENNIGTVVFYSIQRYTMSSYDVARLNVTQDSVNSMGGPKNCFKFTAGTIERISTSKRLLSYVNPLVRMNDELLNPINPLIAEPVPAGDDMVVTPYDERSDYENVHVWFDPDQHFVYAPPNMFGVNKTAMFDCRAVGEGVLTNNDFCFIKSNVDLNALANDIPWETYSNIEEGGTGVIGYPCVALPSMDHYTEVGIWNGNYYEGNDNIFPLIGWGSVGPLVGHSFAFGDVTTFKEPYQQLWHYNNNYSYLPDRVAKARAVGVESGITASWIVPFLYVRNIEYQQDGSVGYLEGNYLAGKIENAKGWGGDLITPYDSYTIVAMGSGETKTVPLADCVYGAFVAMNADPRENGAPYFAILSPQNGYNPLNFWEHSIKGAIWGENPMAYTGRSGAFQEQVNFNYSQQLKDFYADPTWQYIERGGTMASAKNLASGLMHGGAMGAIGAAIDDPYTEYMLSQSGMSREDLLAMGNTYAINQQRREFEKQGEQNAFAMSQNIVAPQISFGNYVNLTRDISGNALRVYYTHVGAKDRKRFDYVNDYFGYKIRRDIFRNDFETRGVGDTGKLTGVYSQLKIDAGLSNFDVEVITSNGTFDWNNNIASVTIRREGANKKYITHFNARYIQTTGIKIKGTNKTPKTMKTDAEAMLNNGVRVWYKIPAGINDPITYETVEDEA